MAAALLDTPWLGTTFAPPQRLDINTIESSLVAQLNTTLKGVVEVGHYPDLPESYRLTHRVGAALVQFESDDFAPPEDTAAVIQERTLRFRVEVVARDLGWAYGGPSSGPSPGVYQILESVRDALTGYQVPGCRKAYPVDTKFRARDKEGAVWYYEMTFAVPGVWIEIGAQANFPALVKFTTLDKSDDSAIALGFAAFVFGASDQIVLPKQDISLVTVTNQAGIITYVAGTDYSLDTLNGIITRLSTGAIAAGATVMVAYSYSDIVTVLASGGTAPTAPTN